MAQANRQPTLTLNLSNPAMVEMMRVVLGYEGAKRGGGRSQAFYNMVMDCVDAEAYPDEVLADLEMLRGRRRQRAIDACAREAELAMSA